MDYLQAPDWDNLPPLRLVGVPTLIDRIDSNVRSGPALILRTSHGELLLQMNEYGVRLLTAVQRVAVSNYHLLENEPEPLPMSLRQELSETIVTAGDFQVSVQHDPLSLSFSVAGQQRLRTSDDGHFVREFRVPPLAKTSTGWLISLAMKSGEAFYGLGEKWGGLNKRGEIVRSFNHDALGVNAERSYKNAPFGWSPDGWGLFCHTPSPVTHAVGHSAWSQRSYCAVVEDDCLDVFFLLNNKQEQNHGAALLSCYTHITGRAPMPPRWSNGVILSKAYYRTAGEILSVAKTVRENRMPCDVITFDGRAWQDTDTRFAFEWDPSRYPDPAKVINQLKALDFKICVWEYPLISMRHQWFRDFAERGWLLLDQRTGEPVEYEWDRGPFGEVLTPLPTSGIVDFTHPEAYAFWRDAHKPLFDLGVDMIKADFGEQLESHMVAHNGEQGSSLHNVYAYLYNKCVYEAAERYSQNGPFLFSRAAWTGSQRFNSQWGGDPQADWEGMISNIRGGLSWGLTGAPFYATDVGGFYKDKRDNSLYVRWAQAGIFSAHFRLHGIGAREPWSYSPEAEQAVMQALELRYQLLAYLEQTELQASESGLPVQRPMVLAFPKESQSWSFENQFMFGEELLVIPCFNPDGEINFYLPEGDWVHFEPAGQAPLDGPMVGGQTYSFGLALNEMAVFARVGSSIPLCKPVQFSGQHGAELEIERVWTAR